MMTVNIVIFLCTYNGESFLTEQLDSIEKQTHQTWQVIASDDNSSDTTLSILKKYQTKWGEEKLIIRKGPQRGFCQNFFSLLSHTPIEAEFYAFCDQDDIWLPKKLEQALNVLQKVNADIPAVYGTRTQLIDEQGTPIGLSPLFSLQPSFANALIQSIAGGNTLVFNHAAKNAIYIDTKEDIISHDWWTYLVITGIGGKFYYDPIPTTCYRQHKSNIIGGKKGFFRKFSRVKVLFSGNLKCWIDSRNKALVGMNEHLTPENQEIFKKFCYYRKTSILQRIAGLKMIGIHRQQWFENFGFYVAVLFNKV